MMMDTLMSSFSQADFPSIVAVVPAGGVGERAGVLQHNGMPMPKQYRYIHGKPMLVHTVEALLKHALVQTVHIGVAPQDTWIDEISLPAHCMVHRTGGASRADTVLNTLQALDLDESTWVMVHDAARPGLPIQVLDNLIKQCLHANKGGILALPVRDTVKKQRPTQDQAVFIQQTIDRQGLWLAQTPQLFPKVLLEKALTRALAQHLEITDEASAVELSGQDCLLIPGHWHNIKVTWSEDFDLVESIL